MLILLSAAQKPSDLGFRLECGAMDVQGISVGLLSRLTVLRTFRQVTIRTTINARAMTGIAMPKTVITAQKAPP